MAYPRLHSSEVASLGLGPLLSKLEPALLTHPWELWGGGVGIKTPLCCATVSLWMNQKVHVQTARRPLSADVTEPQGREGWQLGDVIGTLPGVFLFCPAVRCVFSRSWGNSTYLLGVTIQNPMMGHRCGDHKDRGPHPALAPTEALPHSPGEAIGT